MFYIVVMLSVGIILLPLGVYDEFLRDYFVFCFGYRISASGF